MWTLLVGKNGVKDIPTKKQALALMGSYLVGMNDSDYYELVNSDSYDNSVKINGRITRVQLIKF